MPCLTMYLELNNNRHSDICVHGYGLWLSIWKHSVVNEGRFCNHEYTLRIPLIKNRNMTKRSKTPSKQAKAVVGASKTKTVVTPVVSTEKEFIGTTWVDIFSDPTVVFALICAAVPAIKEGNPLFFWKFLISPLLLFCYALTVFVWKWAHYGGNAKKLTKRRRRAAYWYLMNGIVFHFLMDFAVGTMKWDQTKTLGENYYFMDKRYGCDKRYLGSTEYDPVKCPDEVGYVAILTWIEMVDMIVCFFIFRAYVQDLPSRAPLEIGLAASHIVGTIIFVGAEVYDGMENTPRAYPISGGIKWKRSADGFTDQLTFFWFAFVGCNPVWIIVPFIYGKSAFNEIVNAMRGK